MISIKSIVYSVPNRIIFDRVSFSIADGDRVAIIGPNGAGKSTMLKIILGKLKPEEGSVILSKNSGKIGYMPQHLNDLGELPHKSVLDFLLSGRNLDTLTEAINQKIKEMNQSGLSPETSIRLAQEYSEVFDAFMANGGYSAEEELLEILIGMGLSALDLDQDIQTLSGGQKTKLAFARMLFSRPGIMMLDEPTNHLDEETIDWVVEYLKKFSGTLIMVSHIPSVLDVLVTRIIYLDNTGRAVAFRGNFSQFQKKKGELDASQEKLLKKQENKEKELEQFIGKWRGTTKKKVAQVRDREKKLAKLREEKVDAPTSQKLISVSFPVSVQPVRKILEVRDVCKAYGKKRVLKNINFELFRGERVAIMGPNGAGKSTLLKTVAGKTAVSSGKVILGNKVDIGYYAQEHETLDADNTVFQEMMTTTGLIQSKARSVLAHFLFPGERVFTKVGSLSLGERSRLALAKLVAAGHNFLLLDEPTNHLDIFAREQVKNALSKYEGTILIISHDREFLESIGAERALILPDNKFSYLRQMK